MTFKTLLRVLFDAVFMLIGGLLVFAPLIAVMMIALGL